MASYILPGYCIPFINLVLFGEDMFDRRLTWVKRWKAIDPMNPPGSRCDTVSPSDFT